MPRWLRPASRSGGAGWGRARGRARGLSLGSIRGPQASDALDPGEVLDGHQAAQRGDPEPGNDRSTTTEPAAPGADAIAMRQDKFVTYDLTGAQLAAIVSL